MIIIKTIFYDLNEWSIGNIYICPLICIKLIIFIILILYIISFAPFLSLCSWLADIRFDAVNTLTYSNISLYFY